MTIADRVKKIIVETLGVAADRVTKEAGFIDGLNADSLDLVQLVMDCEEEFGIEISDAEAETWLTVGDAVTYVEKAIG
ncbi:MULTISPECIES: acyl carrier protein [unclassified Mesorhizobium]|uniref:acyl carrier protein n=1 Tax=unclassified Mesorhizobium TaxID=325217 RepID=UPI001129071A|nr:MULTISPECIES: acyl carrier protein [unclassified Mesorhizobium]TPJ57058.1 acyl carrier protein [Mesorhizobium sp. B2-6-1]TPM19820.1 acyl carrier protein [Mesorhizobium sp. B2-3-6]TPN34747.1 acyl carrier protein [Mesorhizobium sp. B1-1-6]